MTVEIANLTEEQQAGRNPPGFFLGCLNDRS